MILTGEVAAEAVGPSDRRHGPGRADWSPVCRRLAIADRGYLGPIALTAVLGLLAELVGQWGAAAAAVVVGIVVGTDAAGLLVTRRATRIFVSHERSTNA